MSSDGCQEVAWVGRAFPYLLHHPRNPAQTDSYARRDGGAESAKHLPSQQSRSDVHARAGTGTWNGPAPRGELTPEQRGTRVAPAQPVFRTPHPRTVRMVNGRMPMLAFGTWQVEDATQAVRDALECGYRHIDCAPAYKNQDKVGVALKEWLRDHKREELWITSKVWNDKHRPEELKKETRQTIDDLACQYLDLLVIHWPAAWKPGTQENDDEVSIQQTWGAMEELVDEGLVKNIGVSNFSAKEVDEILSFCRIKPTSNQVELHPLNAQRNLVGNLMRKGIQCTAYSAMGTSSDEKGTPLREHKTVEEIAKKLGKTPGQIILKWNVQRGVPVLVKSNKRERMLENMDIFDWQLDEESKAKMDGLNQNKRLINPRWAHFDVIEQ